MPSSYVSLHLAQFSNLRALAFAIPSTLHLVVKVPPHPAGLSRGHPPPTSSREPPEPLPGQTVSLWAPAATCVNAFALFTAVTLGQGASCGQEP